jgi:16S rRNA A1518/A1519 N6-dimethyltransferase RsmA/KsgA/DIM1 with predicted DNA glycosylase/AP lyase activity
VAVRRRPAREAPGQHFLRSKALAADLVAGADLTRGDRVVEIGGGTGVLTEALARAGTRVVVLERDRRLAGALRGRFAGRDVHVLDADALRFAWPREPFHVVANLPFAGSGAILARLLSDPCIPLQHACVIVQWEFAAKHARIWPATMRGTYWRAWYDVTIERRLDRTAFAPPPSVDTAVLHLGRRHVPLVPLDQHVAYLRFLTSAFASSGPLRHHLRGRLSPLEVKRLATSLGFAPGACARELDATQWARVFAFARTTKGRSRGPQSSYGS